MAGLKMRKLLPKEVREMQDRFRRGERGAAEPRSALRCSAAGGRIPILFGILHKRGAATTRTGCRCLYGQSACADQDQNHHSRIDVDRAGQGMP